MSARKSDVEHGVVRVIYAYYPMWSVCEVMCDVNPSVLGVVLPKGTVCEFEHSTLYVC